MAENREFIQTNPKLAKSSFVKNLEKLEETKEETPPQKPNVVSIPAPKVVSPPPVTVEYKRPGKFSHPAIRWSLYAFGGFLIVKWAWKSRKPHRNDKGKK